MPTTTRNHTRTTLALAGLALGLIHAPAHAQDQDRDPIHRERSNNRSDERRGDQPPPRPGDRAVFPRDVRTIDGSMNNVANPLWGAAHLEFVRVMASDYADGVGVPAGGDRPSARLISNLVAAQDGADIPNTLGLSDYMWQWGQFLDHDLTETPVADPAEPFDILVPLGDQWFDPFATGTQVIPLNRSAWNLQAGARQQINLLTAYIDASNVYGSEDHRARELRTLDGTGRLKTSAGNLLPFNVNGFDNAPTAHDPSFFLAGDIRANEQVGLTAMHTLFVREHNRQADRIAREHPELGGEEVYQHARAIVAGQMQRITYEEFLPKLLGPDALPPYRGYREDVDAGISNLFATAAYRVGHTMLSTEMLRIDSSGRPIDAGHLDLEAAFFAPDEIIDHGIDSVLRGLAAQEAQDIDSFVVDDLRNFLFGPPGSGGFDLVSLNIQRGRDHGLPGYNAVRVAFGRNAATTFEDVNPDPAIAGRLASAYGSPDDIDAWVGLLAEPHRRGAFVGETLARVLTEQFVRLRDGDRFWYKTYLPRDMADRIDHTTLADIVRRNTAIGDELPDDVFLARAICAADLAAPFGTLDVFDFLEFQTRFDAGDASADFDGSGELNIFDFIAFTNAFEAGCDD